jgi:phage terminase small subunit
MALNEKYRTFVEGVTTHGNGTKAAKDAGFAPHSAHQASVRLLKREDIQRAIARIEARKLQDMGDAAVSSAFTRKQVLEGLHKEATRRGKGSTHAANVTAWRQIAEIEGYIGRGAGKVDTAMLTALKIEIVKPDGEIVKVSAGQAVKQLKE